MLANFLFLIIKINCNQLYGLPAMCQIISVDLIDSSHISAGKRYILKLDIHKKKYSS